MTVRSYSGSAALSNHGMGGRRRRFAGEAGTGRGMCIGLPEFYNRAIHIEQRLACGRWLA